MKKKYIIICAALVVLSAAGGGLGIYLYKVDQYQKNVEALTFSEADLSLIPDGTYSGECDVDFVSAKVEVNMRGGRIEGVRLVEHKNDRGSAAEAVVGRIMEEQRIDVDAVSGATNSSKVIKKAVEDALIQE